MQVIQLMNVQTHSDTHSLEISIAYLLGIREQLLD